jgi:acetolactate synthase-1/2/3 large subunit
MNKLSAIRPAPGQAVSRVADSVARTLAAHGVSRAFGMPGGEVVTFLDALGAAGIAFTLMRNETAAAIAAAATGLLTETPGLLVTTLGPGLANAVNGIADALQERLPLIVLSGAVDPGMRGRYTHQIIDQAALLRGVVKGSFTIDAEAPATVVARAIRLALTHPMGPVHIDLSPRIAEADVGGPDNCPPTHILSPAPGVDDPRFAAAKLLVAAAKKPLIIAGFDAARARCGSVLLTLARQIGAPVITTYKGKGVIDETDVLSLGAAGLSPKADGLLLPLVREADLVLLVGYDPIEMRPGWLEPFGDARIIELQTGPVDHGMHRADLVLTGSITGLLGALSRGDLRPGWSGNGPVRTRAMLHQAFCSGEAWGPGVVASVLQKTLPADAILTVDSGAHRILLSQSWRASRPLSVLQSSGWCTMGAAIPSALAAKLVAPLRPVVAVVGDGGLEMTMGELGSLRDTGAAVIIIVVQDESLALIELKQAQAGLAQSGVRLGQTDYAAIARAFGGHGVTVDDSASLSAQIDSALQRPQFSLIAARVSASSYAGTI